MKTHFNKKLFPLSVRGKRYRVVVCFHCKKSIDRLSFGSEKGIADKSRQTVSSGKSIPILFEVSFVSS